jgi:hypothetical protein
MDAESEVDLDTVVEKSYAGNIPVSVLQSGNDDVNQIHHPDPNIENNETREPTSHNKAEPSCPSLNKIIFKIFKLV